MADKIKDVTVRFKTETDEVRKADAAFDSLNKKISDSAIASRKVNTEVTSLAQKLKQAAAAEQQAAFNSLTASEKRAELLRKEMSLLDDLKKRRKQAFDPDSIRAYGDDIRRAQQNVKLLGGSYSSVSSGAKQFIGGQVAITQSLKASQAAMAASGTSLSNVGKGATKAFGALRTLANIIPGLGISGIILLGYETLIGLFQSLTGSLGENTKAMEINKEAVDKLKEAREGLADELIANADAEAEALGFIGDADRKRSEADEKYKKRILESDRAYAEATLKIKEELGIDEDEVLKAGSSKREAFTKAMNEITVQYNDFQRDAAETLNSEISLINTEAFAKDREEKKKTDEAKKKEQDKASKEYLKILEEEAKHKEEILRKEIEDNAKLFDTLNKFRFDALKIVNERELLEVEEGSEEELAIKIKNIERIRDFRIATEVEFHQDQINIEEQAQNDITALKLKYDEDFYREKTKNDEEYYKEQEKKAKEAADKELEYRKKVLDNSFALTSTFINATDEVLSNNARSQETQLDLAQEKKLERIDMLLSAENISERERAELFNERAILEDDFAKQKLELRRQEVRREKAAAIFNIALNTAEGIVKYLSNPVTAPLIPFLVATGAFQAAAVLSRPIPFAKGVVDLQKGRGGVDDVPAILMRGESVMTTDETREHKDLLNAIRNDYFDKYIAENYINPTMEKFIHVGDSTAGNIAKSIELNFDEYKVGRIFRRNNKVIVENMPRQGISDSEYRMRSRRGLNG